MKKHYIALSLIALASLTSCFDDSTSKTSTKDSTSINSNESKKTNSDKTSPVEPVTPPTIDDKEFSFLLGDYYGKNAKVTIGNSGLTLTGETELSLNATKVENIELEYSKSDEDEETKTYDTLKIDVDKITEFRSTLEFGALEIGVPRASESQRERMLMYLSRLEEADTEEERVCWDKAIHYLLIEATDNQCMTVTYKALDKIMDEYIPRMRSKIIEGMHSEQYLSRAHRTLAEGFAEGKVYKAREGLELHFKYIHQYM